MTPDECKIGKRVRVACGNLTDTGEIVEISPSEHLLRKVRVRFEGREWWYPYSAWYQFDELAPAE